MVRILSLEASFSTHAARSIYERTVENVSQSYCSICKFRLPLWSLSVTDCFIVCSEISGTLGHAIYSNHESRGGRWLGPLTTKKTFLQAEDLLQGLNVTKQDSFTNLFQRRPQESYDASSSCSNIRFIDLPLVSTESLMGDLARGTALEWLTNHCLVNPARASY